MISDDGLTFRANVRLPTGAVEHHETTHRQELLDWLDAHVRTDGLVLAVQVEARASAVPNMIAALRLGAYIAAAQKGTDA